MKKIFNLFTVALFVSLVVLQSCGDDEKPSKNVLVLGSMFTGQFYTVNTTTGALTDLFVPQFDGGDLTDVRAFVYHPDEKKYYVAVTRNSPLDGAILTIDPATKESTVINDNDVDGINVWRALPNWFVTSDDSLFAVGDFNNGIDGFTKFGVDGQPSSRIWVEERDMCCGYGMIYFSKENEIIVSNGDNQENGTLDFLVYNKDAEIKRGFSITNFIGFEEVVGEDWWTIRSLASESNSRNGNVYGVLVNSDTGDTYFVKVDFSNYSITRIADLDTEGGYDFAPLAFVPESVANQ